MMLTTAQAARILNVTPERIRKWVQRGHIKTAGQFAGRTCYDEKEIERIKKQMQAKQAAHVAKEQTKWTANTTGGIGDGKPPLPSYSAERWDDG